MQPSIPAGNLLPGSFGFHRRNRRKHAAGGRAEAAVKKLAAPKSKLFQPELDDRPATEREVHDAFEQLRRKLEEQP